MVASQSLDAPGGVAAGRGRAATRCGAGFLTPIPIQPWVAERMDDKFMHKNDHRTPIMPPIRDGFPPPMCEDPPTEREVLRTMTRVKRGVPYVYEEFRDDIRIVSERIVDKIDPPRFFPLVGSAQLHHCHWKMHDLLHRDDPERLPVPGQVQEAARRGDLHRQGPPAPVRRSGRRNAEGHDPGVHGIRSVIVGSDVRNPREARRTRRASLVSERARPLRCRSTVGVAQLVRAPDCGSGRRGFESRHSPSESSNRVPLSIQWFRHWLFLTVAASIGLANPRRCKARLIR